MLLHRLTSKHLPMPPALRMAIQSKHVATMFAKDGQIAFAIRSDCPNRDHVVAAITQRKQWELWAATIEGAAIACLLMLAFKATLA